MASRSCLICSRFVLLFLLLITDPTCQVIQLSQTNIAGVHSALDSKLHQSVFKKALADEHECLLCLKLCAEAEEGSLRLADHPSGLFTVAVCVMSNFSKSRVLALQLLTKMCSVGHGHKQVPGPSASQPSTVLSRRSQTPSVCSGCASVSQSDSSS